MRADVRLYLASSNPGKVAEFRAIAASGNFSQLELELLPGFPSLPQFDEDAPTFAENAAGKALHYSKFCNGPVFSDDSGLVVPALGGAPGVRSARYAGEKANDADRIAKLLDEMRNKSGAERWAYFNCAIALAKEGKAMAIVTARAEGEILPAPRGKGGFGYDPVFYFPILQKTFAELSTNEKNQYSHRGKAFRKLLASLEKESRDFTG